MSTDILRFQTEVVPVGRCQVQHVEVARDIAQRFNQTFGEVFMLLAAHINESTAIVAGLDGRKMGKSYGNTVQRFASCQQLRKFAMHHVADSSNPTEPMDRRTSTLFRCTGNS